MKLKNSQKLRTALADRSPRIRALAAFLAFCSVLCFVASGCTKDNGGEGGGEEEEESEYMKGHTVYLDYVAKFDESNSYYLFESGNTEDYGLSGLTVSTDIKAEGSEASGFWRDQVSMPRMDFPYVPRDLSEYDALVMNIYSEKATGSTFTLCFNCPYNNSAKKTPYFKFEAAIDWVGWKQIVVNIGEMYNAYNADIRNIEGIRWNNDGWSNTPNKDTKIYFDSVYLTNMTYEYTYDIDQLGDYNYDHIIETFVGFVTGGMSLDNADEYSKAKLEAMVTQATNTAKAMKGSGDPWEYNMNSTAGITSQYSRILQMAKAYAIEGGEHYHSAELLAKIRHAMKYMHNNYYSNKSLHSYPDRNNWWDWEIGSAQHIVNILMLCRDGLSETEIDLFLEPVNTYVPYPSMTMANLVDVTYVCVAASALQKDAGRMVISRNKLDECMGYVKSGDGFYEDGSFIQHTIIPYTGSYGPILLEALSKIVMAVNDTCFHVHDELINEQYSWAVDSFVPLMYHGAFYGLVRGRSICRTSTDVSIGATAFKGMLRMTQYVDEGKANVLKGILKEYMEYNEAYYRSSFEPFDQVLYAKVAADNSVTARVQYEFVKMFALMDRAVASLTDYGVGISLSSSRIAKYEAINEENGRGWYTGDGMLYIYTTVDDYNANYWRNVNMYHIPGTTVTTAPRVDQNIKANDTLSKYDFVGGSYLGMSMAIAMEFESSTAKMKAPTTGKAFSSTLTGKKSWFIFDNEIVCLGAGISSSDSYNTETVLENRRLALTEDLYANGSKVSDKTGVIEDCTSIWFSTLGGIYLPNATDVNYGRYNGSECDSISKDKRVTFLELYIDHGTKFTNETYAYVMLPTMTQDETNAYCADPEVEILSNTADIQAARDKSSGVTAYTFWKAGTFDGVTVSAACSVIVQGNTVAVSDPTMKLETLTVTVNGQSFTVSPENGQTYTFTIA